MSDTTNAPEEAQGSTAPAPLAGPQAYEPGIHANIPAEKYHALPFISNSGLKNFRKWGPRKWKWHLDHPQPEVSTDAQIAGKIFHLATFEPALWGDGRSHYVKPAGMKFSTKEGIKWRDEHTDLPILSLAEHNGIIGAAVALRADDFLGPMLRARHTAEATIIAQHERTGIWLKARADFLTEDGKGRPWILDAKSIADLDGFPFSARDYAYDVQSVFYTDMLERVGVENAGFIFAAVELEPPFPVRLEIIAPESEAAASMLYEADLDRLKACLDADNWPRKYPEIGLLNVPKRYVGDREEI